MVPPVDAYVVLELSGGEGVEGVADGVPLELVVAGSPPDDSVFAPPQPRANVVITVANRSSAAAANQDEGAERLTNREVFMCANLGMPRFEVKWVRPKKKAVGARTEVLASDCLPVREYGGRPG